LYPRIIDLRIRYLDIVEEFSFSRRDYLILEIGSGAMGLFSFLPPSKGELVATDVSEDSLRAALWRGEKVVCDARYLPFRQKTFHAVVCVDSLEHIPKKEREKCLNEFSRVASDKLILHFPATSLDGKFDAKTFDKKFQTFYKNFFGTDHPAIKEHIERGHPSIEEIQAKFPHLTVVGKFNCRTWLKYMIFSSMPIVGFLAGLLYVLFWKRKAEEPPFYGCKVIVHLHS
jgi:hypothetical protein